MERTIQSEGPMTKKKMEEYFKIYRKEGCEKAISAYFSEDAVFENTIGIEACGKKNIIELLNFTHRGDIVKVSFTPTRILLDGDDAAAELVMEVEASEDVLDYHLELKKGEKKKYRVGVFYKIRDGKIAHVKVYPAAVFTPTRRP